MVSFSPAVQPSGVGSSGTVSQIVVDRGLAGYPIVFIEVAQTAGGATHATAEFSTDPTFVDPVQRIATFTSINMEAPAAFNNQKKWYDWDGVISGGIVYFRITAETEVNNNYHVRIHLDEEVKP